MFNIPFFVYLEVHHEKVTGLLFKKREVGYSMISKAFKVKKRLAEKELGRTVMQVNRDFSNELLNKNHDVLCFGIKDTNQIPRRIINKLQASSQFVWLTIDKMANKGRAIDTDLINPLTFRVMTGSTSGGPINILKGINDFAIGTDGGGSVLAPAMSCQLPSIIGAGLGLYVKDQSVSTDRFQFTGSIGVIGKNIETLRDVTECMLEQKLKKNENKVLKIAIPKKGTIKCPDNQDMYEKVMSYLTRIDCQKYTVVEVDMSNAHNRATGIQVIKDSFNREKVDLIVTCEGPIDVYGYGETIQGQFGQVGLDITKNHGKYLVKAANMSHTTALTVPTDHLASGLLIIADQGIENGQRAINFAQKLESKIKLPEAWTRYYLTNNHDVEGYV